MKIAIKTLGCRVNQSESDILAALLKSEDISLVPFEDQADWYIINSCAVTKMSEKKTRQWISRALRNNETSQVILIGCYSPLYTRQFPLPQPRLQVIDSPEKIKKVMEKLNLPWDDSFSEKVIPETKRARVWLKIEDGCDHFCNYCIVPHLRGAVRSEEPEKIIRQAIHLERKGVHEIVLCGINLGRYDRNVAISTDIIVGFPGESEKLFTETTEFCQEIGFSRAHVFVYSPRPFTPASQWDKIEGVSFQAKKDREAQLLKIIYNSQIKYYRSFIGKTLSVLVEATTENHVVTGYSDNYIPVRGEGILASDYGKILPIFIQGEQDRILLGKAIQNQYTV
jgi:tRNA A37 methylthiotransferase MiaB